MRVNVGDGYRLYFTQRGQLVIVMLGGGDKSSQRCDIERARRVAADWEFGS
jgi:putative addiction module killer protein